MTSIIDASAIAEALRLAEPSETMQRLLNLQGLGFWHGDLSEMRGDVPRRPTPTEPPPPTEEAKEMMRHMKMVRKLRDALDHLPAEAREALYLRYDKSLPIEEIAGRLGVTTPVANQLLREALSGVQAMYGQTIDGRDEL